MDNQPFVQPPDFGLYNWIDPELEGTIFVYSHFKKMEDSCKKVDLFSDWAISFINEGKTICSRYDICVVPFYECLCTQFKFKLPFSVFEEGFLNHLAISPSQLHPPA